MNASLLLRSGYAPECMLLFRQHPFGECIIAHPVVTTTAFGEFMSWCCDHKSGITDLSLWLDPEAGWDCHVGHSPAGRAFGTLFDAHGLADRVVDLGCDSLDTIEDTIPYLRRFEQAQSGLQSPFFPPTLPCYLVLAAEHGRYYVKQTEGRLTPLAIPSGEASYGVIPDTSESAGRMPTLCLLFFAALCLGHSHSYNVYYRSPALD